MIRQILLLALLCLAVDLWAQTPEKFRNNQTLTYAEAIEGYRQLAKKHPQAKLLTYGATDSGKPLHLFMISANGRFAQNEIRKDGKVVLLINNAIHAGEPCGVDASMKLATDLLSAPEQLQDQLAQVVIGIVPVYNIGGALNRNCCTRANQNGPEEYGFRGNAQNLDLNRDFIKADSKNARSFARIIRELDPDVFVDTHTSNGADYQYNMTLIATQPDKLHPNLGNYLRTTMLPGLYGKMEADKEKMTPYVNSLGRTPDEAGIADFLDAPRYSTGYTALFETIGFTTEAHMLKPFENRVMATYTFLQNLIDQCNEDYETILFNRQKAKEMNRKLSAFPVAWTLDTTRFESLMFDGYEGKHKKSEVTGKKRLYYDRKSPYSKPIPYFNHYQPGPAIQVPEYYILPQAWSAVAERLLDHGVEVNKLKSDLRLDIDAYYIVSYETRPKAYEGHHLHSDVKTRIEAQSLQFYAGDYVIPTDQAHRRLIVELLEPTGPDGYFAWNFFDPILMQKEWFSDYVFEETAAKLLAEDPALKAEYEAFKVSKDFDSHWPLLYYIYQRSPHFEPGYNRYPVYRFSGNVALPIE